MLQNSQFLIIGLNILLNFVYFVTHVFQAAGAWLGNSFFYKECVICWVEIYRVAQKKMEWHTSHNMWIQ